MEADAEAERETVGKREKRDVLLHPSQKSPAMRRVEFRISESADVCPTAPHKVDICSSVPKVRKPRYVHFVI